jgi:hypothetical protein
VKTISEDQLNQLKGIYKALLSLEDDLEELRDSSGFYGPYALIYTVEDATSNLGKLLEELEHED